ESRIFVEFDRSTKSHTRVSKDVACYVAYGNGARIEDPFDRPQRPVLLYVTKSSSRALNISRAARASSLGNLEFQALPFPRAIDWLRNRLFDDALAETTDVDDAALLRKLCAETETLKAMLDRHGITTPALPTLNEACELLHDRGGIG